MPGIIIPVVILFVGLVIFGIIHASKAAKKRQEELFAWAIERDWHFAAGEVSSMERRFPAFQCFQQGNNRYAYNVMRGPDGERDVFAFDYHYETQSTDSKGNTTTHHHRFSAVIVDSGLNLEPLSIRAESFFDKMKGAFGFDDIDFESAEFSRKFWVTAKNKRWAYTVINQKNMEFLLAAPRYTLQFDGPYVLAHRSSTFSVDAFSDALKVINGLLDHMPKDVVKERRR